MPAVLGIEGGLPRHVCDRWLDIDAARIAIADKNIGEGVALGSVGGVIRGGGADGLIEAEKAGGVVGLIEIVIEDALLAPELETVLPACPGEI